MTEEQKEKYANFLDKISEILGLNKPVDILRLCAVTDEYLRPIEKHITELEKENAELKETVTKMNNVVIRIFSNLTKAKEIISNLYAICKDNYYPNSSVLMEQAEQFLSEVEK